MDHNSTKGTVLLGPDAVEVTLRVNGTARHLTIEPRVTLLDALREHLGLTGSKKGCDRGECGACTVLVDGRRINACMTFAVMQAGPGDHHHRGAGPGRRAASAAGRLHPARRLPVRLLHARADHVGGGACWPRATLATDAEIREWMSGNICRCGAYPNIVAAIRQVAQGQAGR